MNIAIKIKLIRFFQYKYELETNSDAIAWMKDMRQQYQLIWSKTRLLSEQVSNSAMHATRDAAAQQNAQRKSAHLRMKEHISNDLCVRLVLLYFLPALAFK